MACMYRARYQLILALQKQYYTAGKCLFGRSIQNCYHLVQFHTASVSVGWNTCLDKAWVGSQLNRNQNLIDSRRRQIGSIMYAYPLCVLRSDKNNRNWSRFCQKLMYCTGNKLDCPQQNIDSSEQNNLENKWNTKELLYEATHTSSSEVVQALAVTLKTSNVISETELYCVEKHLQLLLDIGLSPLKLKELVDSSMFLLLSDNFSDNVQNFHRYGFSANSIYKFCKDCPQIFQRQEKSVTQFIENLRNIGFQQKQIQDLINLRPDVLVVSPEAVRRRVNELKNLFKSQDVLDLCLKSPQVIDQDFDVIKSKFDYVFHVMAITQRQMMYSKMFNYTLQHIQNRHIFVSRAGLFKKIKKKIGEKNTNPLLQDILDTTNNDFIKKFGHVSVVDYKAFCDMMAIERETEMSDDEDIVYDSSDEDSD